MDGLRIAGGGCSREMRRRVETNRGGEGREGKGRKTVYPFLRARNFLRKSACSPQPLQRSSRGNLQQAGSPVPGRWADRRHRNSKAHPANKRASVRRRYRGLSLGVGARHGGEVGGGPEGERERRRIEFAERKCARARARERRRRAAP